MAAVLGHLPGGFKVFPGRQGRIALVTEDGRLVVADPDSATGIALRAPEPLGEIADVALSGDRMLVVSGGEDEPTQVWVLEFDR